MPHLTQLTSPLRELTRKDVLWCWHEEHENAFVAIKQAAASVPLLLRYYNVNDEVTLQCDASKSGLGLHGSS